MIESAAVDSALHPPNSAINRDLDTLTHKEMLALAILPRAPSALDLYKNPEAIEASIARLAQAMEERHELTSEAHRQLLEETIPLEPPVADLATTHFINYIRDGNEDNKDTCFPRTEYFIPGTEPKEPPPEPSRDLTLVRPTKGLQIAYDPRIPASVQAFEFVADGGALAKVEWLLDGKKIGESDNGRFLWPVTRGHHILIVRKAFAKSSDKSIPNMVHFNVK